MKQKMDEFEESLNCISIMNSITELRNSIKQLENKYKYASTSADRLWNNEINNRNEELKEEQKLHNKSNSNTKSNIRSTQVKASNPILNQNVDNSIDWSDLNLWDELMAKNLEILEQFDSK